MKRRGFALLFLGPQTSSSSCRFALEFLCCGCLRRWHLATQRSQAESGHPPCPGCWAVARARLHECRLCLCWLPLVFRRCCVLSAVHLQSTPFHPLLPPKSHPRREREREYASLCECVCVCVCVCECVWPCACVIKVGRNKERTHHVVNDTNKKRTAWAAGNVFSIHQFLLQLCDKWQGRISC